MVLTNLQASCRGRLPLCVRYASVHLDEVRFGGEGIAQVGGSKVPFGVGVLDDGLEVLGVWHEEAGGPAAREAIATDLVTRGLVSFRVLVSSASPQLDAAVLAEYPEAQAVRSFQQWCAAGLSRVPPRRRSVIVEGMLGVRRAVTYDDALERLRQLQAGEWEGEPQAVQACRDGISDSRALYLLPQRLRKATHRAEEVVQRLQAGAQAALRRGCFESPREAAQFAEAWLTKAVRKLGTPTRALRPMSEGRRGHQAVVSHAPALW